MCQKSHVSSFCPVTCSENCKCFDTTGKYTYRNRQNKEKSKECKKIKESREFEREQFGWQKQKQDIIAIHKAELKKKNNLDNLRFLAQQIQEDR